MYGVQPAVCSYIDPNVAVPVSDFFEMPTSKLDCILL